MKILSLNNKSLSLNHRWLVSESGYLPIPPITSPIGICNNWIPSTPLVGDLYFIAMSANGQYQTIAALGNLYISTDYGNNWTPKESGPTWYSIAMSASGQYQTAVSVTGAIYNSIDYGNTWALNINLTMEDVAPNGISISTDGSIQTLLGYKNLYDRIYISTDYGNNWTLKKTLNSLESFNGVSISSTGQYQTAVIETGLTAGAILRSSNYGNTWAGIATPRKDFSGIAISSTGQYQTAIVMNEYIYKSIDYGNTWTPVATDVGKPWSSIAMSSDGRIQTAIAGRVWSSIDYGDNWVATDILRSGILSVDISSDGSKQTAIGIDGLLIKCSCV